MLRPGSHGCDKADVRHQLKWFEHQEQKENLPLTEKNVSFCSSHYMFFLLSIRDSNCSDKIFAGLGMQLCIYCDPDNHVNLLIDGATKLITIILQQPVFSHNNSTEMLSS